MTRKSRHGADPLARAIENALQPGRFISYGASHGFVSDLEEVASEIEKILRADGERPARLYETFIAYCYGKAEEIDDSGGNLGMFVESLFCGWIKARVAAGANRDETAKTLLDWMDGDEYGFCHQLEREAVKGLKRLNGGLQDGLVVLKALVRRLPDDYIQDTAR